MIATKRFEVLDSFRGLCAIAVVLYHLHVIDSVAEANFFRGSSLFVEFFFVLSGFVLAHGYAFRKELTFKPYITNRIFRLFPLHVFMLCVFVALEAGKWVATQGFGFQLNNEAFTNDYALEGLIPNLLLIHAWTPFTNPLSFNTPSWSISIEFYMYILLFVTIVFFTKMRSFVWILIPILMFILMFTKSDLLVSPVMRGLSGFFGGVCCYLIYRRFSDQFKVSKLLATMAEVFLISLVFFVVQSDIAHRSILATFTFFATVWWFANEAGFISSLLKHAVFQFCGKLSYSIYMTHAGVIYVLTSLFLVIQKLTGVELMSSLEGVRYFNLGDAYANNAFVLVTLMIVLMCSYVTYKLVEVRWQKIGKDLLRKQQSIGKFKTSKVLSPSARL